MKGFTLVEAIVACALAFLLLALSVRFLIPCFQAQLAGSTRVELQDRGDLTMTRLAQDFQTTDPVGLSLHNGNPSGAEQYPEDFPEAVPVILSVVPILGVQGNAQLDWSDRPVLLSYDRPSQTLWRAQWPHDPPDLSVNLSSARPERLPDADLTALAGQGLRQPLCRNLSFCDVRVSGSTVNVTLLLEDPAHREKFRLQRTVQLRNP